MASISKFSSPFWLAESCIVMVWLRVRDVYCIGGVIGCDGRIVGGEMTETGRDKPLTLTMLSLLSSNAKNAKILENHLNSVSCNIKERQYQLSTYVASWYTYLSIGYSYHVPITSSKQSLTKCSPYFTTIILSPIWHCGQLQPCHVLY